MQIIDFSREIFYLESLERAADRALLGVPGENMIEEQIDDFHKSRKAKAVS